MLEIHDKAIVEDGAELGRDVTIGPYSYVGSEVKIGDSSRIREHVIIKGRTQIGRNNQFWPFASIGTDPQDLKFRGEKAELIIGDANNFREYSNVSIGTAHGGGRTVIGNNNLFMVSTHIAHDCIIRDNCIFSNSASLAGHIEVDSHAVIGGMCGLHQFVKVGAYTMLGGGSILVKDLPPFTLAHGNHARAVGINVVGLKRADFSSEKLREIRSIFKILFLSNLTVDDARAVIGDKFPHSDEAKSLFSFIERSTRGLAR